MWRGAVKMKYSAKKEQQTTRLLTNRSGIVHTHYSNVTTYNRYVTEPDCPMNNYFYNCILYGTISSCLRDYS